MAEIVPGIICDDRMEDRVQVILVLTGIGTTALDPQRMKRPVPVMTPAEDTDKETSLSPGNSYQENIPDVHPELAAAQSELDVPAFMRRKAR